MHHSSPFAAVFTPGTRFEPEFGGPIVMSTRELGALQVPSGRIIVCDPGATDFAAPQRPLARTAPTGVFPVELALAEFDGRDVRVACARVRFAAGPVARWEPALFEGQAPGDGDADYEAHTGIGCFLDADACATVDDTSMQAWNTAIVDNRVHAWTWHIAELGRANVVMFSSGDGDGLYRSYWGLDEHDQVVELVTDFDLLREMVHEQLELSLPLPGGRVEHPWLEEHGVLVSRPVYSATSAVVQGPAGTSVYLSQNMVMRERWNGDTCRYDWRQNSLGLRLVISVRKGIRRLEPL